MAEEYAARASGMGALERLGFRVMLGRLRRFDLRGAQGVDDFIANSAVVRERIQRIYHRDAVVIHPPVDVDRFHPAVAVSDYYLVVAELVPYKRIDLAVAACSSLGRKLVVVGDGPELQALRRLAGPTVEFRGRLKDVEVSRLMATCRAFIHPQIEDFGIAAVEAQAAGRPVIAFRGGGALETVVPAETGVFFDVQSEQALTHAIVELESSLPALLSDACRKQAERFNSGRFRRELRSFLASRGYM